MAEWLPIWTIYDHPLDYPDSFVVVEGHVTADGETRHGVWTAATLDAARAVVEQINPGAVCLPRSHDDDPVIVESWV